MSQPKSTSQQIAELIRAGHSPSRAIAMCMGGNMPGYAAGGSVMPDNDRTAAQVAQELSDERARLDADYAMKAAAQKQALLPPKPPGIDGEVAPSVVPAVMTGSAPGLPSAAAMASDRYYNNYRPFAYGGAVHAMASGGEMSDADLATLKDMFGPNSPALNDALTGPEARQAALQETLGKAVAQDTVNQATTPGMSQAAYDALFGAEKGIVPTGSDAGAQLVGAPYGGQPALTGASGADIAAEGANLPAVQGGMPAVQSSLPAVQGRGALQAAAGGAGDDAIETTGRVLGEEAAPAAARGLGLPLAVAYEALKSTPANAGEDALMKDRLQKWAADTGNPIPSLAQDKNSPSSPAAGTDKAPETYGPPSGTGKPGDANGPSLFDMVSGAYKAKSPAITAPASAVLGTRSPATAASSSTLVQPTTDTPAPVTAPTTGNPLLTKYLQDRQDMKAALDQANTNRLTAGLAGALGQIGASTYASNRPVNEAAFKQLQENASAPVTAQQTMQAAGMKGIEEQAALMKASAEQEAQNPNSPTAAALRKIYAPILAKNGLPTDVMNSMGAADIKAYAQNPTEFAMKMKEMEIQKQLALEMQRTRLQNAQDQHDFMHLQTQQNAMNHEAQKPNEAIAAADNALKTIDMAGSNPIAWSATPMAMARQIAGGQRINKQEIEGMQGSKAIADHLMQIGQQASEGTITPANQRFFTAVAQSMKDAAQDDVNNIYMRHVKQYAVNAKKPLKDAYESVVGVPMPQPVSAGAGFAPDVMKYASDHGITPQQAAAIKAARTGAGGGTQ